MIVQEEMRVVAHREIALNIFELVLEGHLVEQITEPGQFVHIRTSKGVDPHYVDRLVLLQSMKIISK